MTSFITIISNRYLHHYTGLSKKCWTGISLSCTESFLIGIYSFLPLYFTSTLHFSIVAASALVSCYGFGAIVGGYLSGHYSDRYSPGKIAVASLLLQSLSFFLLISLKTSHSIAIVMMLMGIASYGFLTALNLWILSECDNEKKRLQVLNMLSASANIGSGLSALCIGYFIVIGFNPLFYIVAISLIVCACYFATILRAPAKITHYKTISNPEQVTKSALPLWIMLLCLFLVGLIIFQANTTFSIYIQNKYPHLGLRAVSILFAINCFMVVLLQTPLINGVAKFNKLVVAGIGALLLGSGMVVLTIASSFVIAIIAYAIHTLGEILFFGVAQFICYQSASIKKKGQALGLFRTTYASARIVGPILGALVYDTWGSNTLWYLCGFLGLICFEACNFSKKMM